MPSNYFCPQCGAEMPADSPQGVCPRCLLALGMSSRVEAGTEEFSPQSARFTPPKPHQLEQHFPQLEILDLIGQGGMGAVYKARQRGLDRLVALKILPVDAGRDPSFTHRFGRESRALARLNHPHIVTVYDSGQSGGLYYFLMEFVDGVNLREAIRAGQLSAQEALAIVPQICDALQYAHDEGIVHRDIKPENVLIDKKGHVKIADFGLARLLGQADVTLTGSQQVMGTPRYMAPEQMEGAHEVDHRADIYSLGVVFYEMLTGELPLGRFAPPSQKVQIDVRLDDVVLRTLEKEPDRRYQHASDVKTDVESIGHLSRLPPHLRRLHGYEYRSPQQLFGLPLVHIATGIDPKTGRRRIAKGIIAIGDVALGGVAIGGAAAGGVALGGGAVGLLAVGGGAAGLLFALGGGAIGMGISVGGLAAGAVGLGGLGIGLFANGGLALGYRALGAAAVGYHACGVSPHGIHTVNQIHAPPEVVNAFHHDWLSGVFSAALVLCAVAPLTVPLLLIWLNRLGRQSATPPGQAPSDFDERSRYEPGALRDESAQGLKANFVLGCAAAAAFVLAAIILGLWSLQSLRDRQTEQARDQALRAKERAEQLDREMAGKKSLQQAADHAGWDWSWQLTDEGTAEQLDREMAGKKLLQQAALSDSFVRSLELKPQQVADFNRALQDAFQQYLELERRHLQQQRRADGHLVTTVNDFRGEVAGIENELLTRLDTMLTVEQQRLVRLNLELYPPNLSSGFLSDLVRPGLLGWGDGTVTIETWRIGSWYHWRIDYRKLAEEHTSQEFAPQPPAIYRRFWDELPPTGDPPEASPGEPAADASHAAPD